MIRLINPMVGIVGSSGNIALISRVVLRWLLCTCMKSFTHTRTSQHVRPDLRQTIDSTILFVRSPVSPWLKVVQWHGFLLSVAVGIIHTLMNFPCWYIKDILLLDMYTYFLFLVIVLIAFLLWYHGARSGYWTICNTRQFSANGW